MPPGLFALEKGLVWEWARPAGLWGLLLPLLLWLLVRLRVRPPSVATGTLSLWKEISRADPRRAARKSRRTPPFVRWMIAALAFGALALAGPRLVRPEPPRVWTLVVDHATSTGLPFAAGETRLEVALRRALDRLAELIGPADRVRWLSSARPTLELTRDERPPAEWVAHPAWNVSRPRWELFDAPGFIWVTDAAPEIEPESAGLFTSGGAAVPGPIAVRGTTRLDWDGERVVEVENGAATRGLRLPANGASLPEPLRAIALVWARDRGFLLKERDDGDVALAIELVADDGEPLRIEAGRDRWSVSALVGPGGVPPLDTKAPQVAWLAAPQADGARLVLVRASPGLVRVACREMGEPRGDPAAFAVSWSRLFEAWALPAPGVLPLSVRAAAGAAVDRDPEPPPVPRESADDVLPADRIDAYLAAAAALLGAVALSVGAAGLRLRPT